CLVPKRRFRIIAKYAKPPYNERVVSGSPAMLGPVAQESVVDSALLRSIFRPFKPAFLYTTCTQIAPRGTCHITSGLPVIRQESSNCLGPIPRTRLLSPEWMCARERSRTRPGPIPPEA